MYRYVFPLSVPDALRKRNVSTKNKPEASLPERSNNARADSRVSDFTRLSKRNDDEGSDSNDTDDSIDVKTVGFPVSRSREAVCSEVQSYFAPDPGLYYSFHHRYKIPTDSYIRHYIGTGTLRKTCVHRSLPNLNKGNGNGDAAYKSPNKSSEMSLSSTRKWLKDFVRKKQMTHSSNDEKGVV